MNSNDLTKRAAEAIEEKRPSEELSAIRREVASRIDEVAVELKVAKVGVDISPSTGDIESVRKARQREADLTDESKILHQVQRDLHHAIQSAWGVEAVAAEAEHRRNLARALTKAEKADQLIQEAASIASTLVIARQRAGRIGESLAFDKQSIRSLAEAIHPKGSNDSKQLMIDLGIRGSRPNYV